MDIITFHVFTTIFADDSYVFGFIYLVFDARM